MHPPVYDNIIIYQAYKSFHSLPCARALPAAEYNINTSSLQSNTFFCFFFHIPHLIIIPMSTFQDLQATHRLSWTMPNTFPAIQKPMLRPVAPSSSRFQANPAILPSVWLPIWWIRPFPPVLLEIVYENLFMYSFDDFLTQIMKIRYSAKIYPEYQWKSWRVGRPKTYVYPKLDLSNLSNRPHEV